MPEEQATPLAIEVLDDGRIAVVSRSGVAVSTAGIPEPDPRRLDGLPNGAITIADWGV
jgi:hypothetical protein